MASSLRRKSTRSVHAQDQEALEFCPLTQQAINDLLERRTTTTSRSKAACRRQAPRWPFPGTVELWLPDKRGGDRYALATSINLSHEGIGIQFEDEIPLGTPVKLAIHEPELTFHGRAVIRHCTQIETGEYILGMQFVFDE